MALAERSGRSRLVDVFAIEGEFPLHGEVWTDPPHRWPEGGIAAGDIFVDSTLLVQLDVALGDRLRLGRESFEIVAAVRKAPGSFGLQSEVAPRVFVRRADLARTGLVQEGSLVSHLRYLRLPAELVDPWVEQHEELLELARVRVQTVSGYQEDLSEAFGTLTRYLGLVGLAALMLGSIGVAAGVRVFVREKLEGVAMLRSIGASPRDVVLLHAGLAVALGLAAGALGILLCLPLVAVLPGLLGDLLPVEIGLGVGPGGIATGLGLALWATCLCAMGPISDLARVPPLRALRRDFGDGDARAEDGRMLALGVTIASVLGVSVWQAGDWRVGLWFAGGLVATVAVLGGAAMLLIRALRRFPPRGLAYWARQGIANLFRPRNHTLPTTIAIGFALFLVATLHGVQSNVLRQMSIDAREDRPNFVLFDVQRDQLAGVRRLLDEHEAAVVDEAPLVSARIAAVAGTRRGDWLLQEDLPRDRRWALQREYRLTYADAPRDTEALVAGSWWSPDDARNAVEPYPISLEDDLAESLGVGLGDAVRWQIQGVEVDTRVASLREVDWGRMATNFFVVFPTAALEAAPQSTVLLAHLASERGRAELQRELVGRFPNVSALDATLILRSLDTMLSQIGIAIRLLSMFTLGTGVAILVAASLAGRSERAREALLLRVLGASRKVLRRIVATEAVVLAALASVVGAVLAAIAAFGIVVFLFELPFDPPLRDWILLALGTFTVTALFAGATGASVARASSGSPQAALRREPT